MTLRHFSARGLIGVLAVGVLAAACSPDPGSTPSASPTAGASATATPAPTRTETAEEQKEREAFEAAEKAYRINWAESARLAIAGGADKPTRVLLDTSMGEYLEYTMLSLRGIKENRLHANGPGEIAWIRNGAYSADKLVLRACEDYRDALLIKKDGSVYTPAGTRVYDQTITAQRVKGTWKLSEQVTEQVKEC